MKLLAFTIRDIKAEAFNTPFFLSTQGQALRSFSDLANDKQTTVGQHPEDFQLFLIGDFDTDTADLQYTGTKLLATGSDMQNLQATPIARIG